MDSINRVLNSKFFVPVLNFIILSLIWSNIYYFIRISSCNQFHLSLEKQNSTIRQEIAKINNRENYQNSLSYQDKSIRERGYRLKSEEVVDFSLIEGLPEDPGIDYLPENKISDQNNIDSWIKILNGKDNSSLANSSCN